MAKLETISYPRTEEEWEKFRKKVNSLKNKANNRLKRLEKNRLEDTPAYKAFTTYHGEPRFGIKGKTNKEVRAEYFKIKHFLEAGTSTVKGAEKYLQQEMRVTKLMTGATGFQATAQLKDFWKIADGLRKTMEAVNKNYLSLDSERVITSVRQVIRGYQQGADDIKDMGDALVSAWGELERSLPRAVESDVLDKVQEYIDSLDDKELTLTLNF